MAQLGLDLSDVCLMLQNIGSGRGPEPMHAQSVDLNPGLFHAGRDQGIDAVGPDAGTGQLASQQYEQRHLPVGQMMP